MNIDELLGLLDDEKLVTSLRSQRAELVQKLAKIDRAMVLLGASDDEVEAQDAGAADLPVNEAHISLLLGVMQPGHNYGPSSLTALSGLRSDPVYYALVAMRARGLVSHNGKRGTGSLWTRTIVT